MSEFHSGDKVRIVIEPAEVQYAENGNLEYEYVAELGTCEGVVALDSDAVTVERIVWPPRPGDLWRSRHGNVWFAVPDISGVGLTADGRSVSNPDKVAAIFGPLTLVHREEASES